MHVVPSPTLQTATGIVAAKDSTIKKTCDVDILTTI